MECKSAPSFCPDKRLNLRKVALTARAEIVKADNRVALAQEILDNVRANEAGSASHENAVFH
jgi:hypothetical protein